MFQGVIFEYFSCNVRKLSFEVGTPSSTAAYGCTAKTIPLKVCLVFRTDFATKIEKIEMSD